VTLSLSAEPAPPDALAAGAGDQIAEPAITQEDSRQTIDNVSGFFSLLFNWGVSNNTEASK
jgi:hypothetical protein